jgi:hypothetical protein
MARFCLPFVLVLATLSLAQHASAIAPSPPKAMPTPCYAKYFNGFCYVEDKKDVCTFYSSPTYA